MSSNFKQNGGLCAICDSNHSNMIDPRDWQTEICSECWEKSKAYVLQQRRN